MAGPAIVRLPVEGRTVRFKAMDGVSEMLVAESRAEPARVALQLLARIAEPVDGGSADWAGLTVTDFEVLLLALRRDLFGARVLSDFRCPDARCGERVEMEFSLIDYLDAVRPHRPKGVGPAPGRTGWWRLGDVFFRLPSAEDQIAAHNSEDGVALLAECCLGPALSPSARRRAETAMAAMAPEVSGPIGGVCPGCGRALDAMFHAPSFVIGEMRRAFTLLGEEVDLIASAYHWQEADILAMPRVRRQTYADRIRRRLAA